MAIIVNGTDWETEINVATTLQEILEVGTVTTTDI